MLLAWEGYPMPKERIPILDPVGSWGVRKARWIERSMFGRTGKICCVVGNGINRIVKKVDDQMVPSKNENHLTEVI